jgi:hypothetical protein
VPIKAEAHFKQDRTDTGKTEGQSGSKSSKSKKAKPQLEAWKGLLCKHLVTCIKSEYERNPEVANHAKNTAMSKFSDC